MEIAADHAPCYMPVKRPPSALDDRRWQCPQATVECLQPNAGTHITSHRKERYER
jgi:hypothetical protein